MPKAAHHRRRAGGALVGFVTIDASGYLDQLVVAPDRWGSRARRQLVDEAKRRSPDGVTLKVNADNARAIRFYERNGFVHAGEDVNPTSKQTGAEHGADAVAASGQHFESHARRGGAIQYIPALPIYRLRWHAAHQPSSGQAANGDGIEPPYPSNCSLRQPRIEPARRDQLGVGALLDDAALIHAP